MTEHKNVTPLRQCDRQAAEHFLTLLDEDAESFIFQVIDDSSRNRPDLTRCLIGSLDQHYDELVQCNQKGAGIFVTVNETDGTARKKENITRIRAVWQEADRGGEPTLPLEPHIVVNTSPGKHHRYLLTNTTAVDEFEAIQQRVVDDYGSDPNAKDRARVLRMPGFYHNKGEPHLVAIIHESGELPFDWKLIKQKLPPVERKQSSRDYNRPANIVASDELINPAEVYSALRFIKPDMDYLDWLKMGMALHDASGGSIDGLNLWDSWSRRGDLYRDGECEYRWSTFGKSNGEAVTIRTLFAHAQVGGWDGRYVNDEHCRFLVPQEYNRRIAAFNKTHAHVLVEGRAAIVYVEWDDSLNRWRVQYSSFRDLREHHVEYLPYLDNDDGKEIIRRKELVPTWMKSPGRTQYDRVTMVPVAGKVASSNDVRGDGHSFNLYRGLAIEPKPGEHDLILQHIKEVWCANNEIAYEYVINWLARLYQHPGELGHTALVLKSGEGSGKGIIVDLLTESFGGHGVALSNARDLTGPFNDYMATSILVYTNEATWGGDKSHAGVIKSLITDPQQSVNRKFVPKFEIRSCVHLIMSSNEDWIVPVGIDDRRFVILDVSDARKGDFDYFARLKAQIDNGGGASFIHHLMERDISEFNPRNLPGVYSETKQANKIMSADSPTRWWYECLERGYIERRSWRNMDGKEDFEFWPKHWDAGPLEIPQAELKHSFDEWVRSHRREEHGTLTKLTRTLNKLGGAKVKRESTGERKYAYAVRPLSEARANMDAAMGEKGDWPMDEDENEQSVPF